MLIRLALLALLGACGYALWDYDRRLGPAPDGPTNEFERRLLAVEEAALPGPEAFSSALAALREAARAAGSAHFDVSASALAKRVTGAGRAGPSSERSCAALRNAMSRGDMVLKEPRSGVGPSLTVRYFL